VFFVYEGATGMEITLVAEPGPDQVIRRFNLDIPAVDYSDVYEAQYSLVSENGLIVNNRLGIHLYHIPEPRTVGNDCDLPPIWSWWRGASGYRSTLYKTASPYHALWLQGGWATHTLEFDVDESGFPMVVNHHVTEGQPAYYVEDHLKLQGRKGMGFNVEEHGEIVLNTGVLGKPDVTRQLRAQLPGLYDGPRLKRDEVKYTDLDEVTGRIMIVVGPGRGRMSDNIPYARRLCLADLPI